MRWLACSGTAFQSPPPARMGHVALAITWGGGEELLLVHAGLSEEKYALADLAVLQTATEAWFYPEAPADQAVKPPARAFHCGAVLGRTAYVFGGHVWVKDKRGLQKFNDLWALDTVRSRSPRVPPGSRPGGPADGGAAAQDMWAWSKVEARGAQPAPRDFAGLVDLPDGRLLLFGGLDTAEKRLDDTWVFDPARCVRQPCPPAVPRARRLCGSGRLAATRAGAPGRSSRWSGTRARATRTRWRAWPTACSCSAARPMQVRPRRALWLAGLGRPRRCAQRAARRAVRRPVDAARPGRRRRGGQLDPAGAAGHAAVGTQGRRHGRCRPRLGVCLSLSAAAAPHAAAASVLAVRPCCCLWR